MDIKSHSEKPRKAIVTVDTPDELFVAARSLLASDMRFFQRGFNDLRVIYWRNDTSEYPRELTLSLRELGRIAEVAEISYIVATPEDAEHVSQLAAVFAEQADNFVNSAPLTN